MPALSAPQQRKRRIAPHAADHYLVILKPTIVFRALVNMASVTYPTASITFDTVTVGAYTDILPGMTVRVGSATKHSDYGTTYVRAAASSTAIPIGWSSQGRDRPGEVDLVDNAYIEVLDMREIWMESPRILDDGTIYKKYDIAFSPNSPPVANIGPDYAEFVSGGAIHVLFNDTPGQSAPDDFASFATAPGASIASRAWDFVDGTPSSASTTNPGSVSFPAGQRYASLTVTDSNGEEHTAYALIVGCEATGANAPITNFQITSHRHSIEGQTLQFKVFDELDSADYPPGTRVLIFARERFGQFTRRTGTRNGTSTVTGIDTTDLYEEMSVTGDGVPFNTTIATIDSSSQITLTQAVNGSGSVTFTFRTVRKRLTGPTGRSQMVFSGWLTEEDNELSWSERGLQRGLTFTAVDTAGRLAQLPGFTQEMRRKNSPTKWGQASGANIPRYIHYLLHWHSNALSLCDFQWSGTDYNFSWLNSDGSTLYNQTNSRAEAMAARLGCDAFGRLMIGFDPQLQPEDERTDVETVSILNSDWKSLKWKLVRPPRNYWLKGAALLTSEAESDADNPYPVYARAPGFAPGQGASPADQNYQLVRTTQEEFDREGQRYATRLNAKHGAWAIPLVHGAYCGIDPIRMEWIRLYVADANKSLRGLAFPSGKRFLPIEVNYSYDFANGVVYQEVSAEEEVIGLRAPDDPQPQASPNPYGDGGPPIWGIIAPFPDPPPVGIGDFIYTPALPTPLNPLPGKPDEYGMAFGGTPEGFAFRVTWPGGTITFENISPSIDQREAIGTAFALRRDARDYKRYWLIGSTGILRTDNIKAASVRWVLALHRGEYNPATTERTYDYKINQQGFTAYDVPQLRAVHVAGSGWHKSPLRSDRITFSIIFPKEITISTVVVTLSNATLVSSVGILYGGVGDYISPVGNTATSTTDDDAASITIDVVMDSSVDPYVTSIKITTIGAGPDKPPGNLFADGEIIADFQSCINRKDAYYWLSKRTVNSVDYVFLNATFDKFLTLNSTQVGKYVANMLYGFTVSSFNYRKIWVAAGDPADNSAALYASTDGGAKLTKTAALLNEFGGAPWLNYSKSNKAKNTLDADLMWIKGRDGSDNFQFVKGISGTPTTIINSATKDLVTPLGFGVIARDLDFVRIAFRDADFYVSSNTGGSWAASATDVPAGGDVYGWSQFPAATAFAFAYGEETLVFTTDSGATWTDMWTDYASFIATAFDGDGTTVIGILPDLSVRYPVPIGG